MLRRQTTDLLTAPAHRSMARSRWAAIGAAIAVTFGAGGLLRADAAGDTPTAPALFVAVTPCRLMDTREAPGTVGPRAVPLAADETYTVRVAGTNGHCTLPADAATLVMNITVTGQSASSYLTVYAAGDDRPATSSLNWETGSGDVANAVTSNASQSGEVSFYSPRGTANIIADVVGYYSSAPLGNFYTKGDVDALIAANPAGVGPVGPKGDEGAAGPQGDPGQDSNIGELECSTSQSIVWSGTAWICRNTTIVSTLTKVPGSIGGGSVGDYFEQHSANVDPTGYCDNGDCLIYLADVPDHHLCQVTFTGNDPVASTNMHAVFTTTYIDLQALGNRVGTMPLYVNISCDT
jgi:hypothetical protein